MPDDKALPPHEEILAALSDVEGHKHKRIELMTRALVPATGNGELQVFDDLEYCEAKAGALFEAAWADDPDAVAALCLIASRLLLRGARLPPLLAATISQVLAEQGISKPKRKRGRHSPYDNVTRDIAIIRRIQNACEAEGVFAMRSPSEKGDGDLAAGKPCGCSIVADELGMDERAVEEIWGKRTRYGIT